MRGRFIMRVIAGTARRLRLKTLEGLETRPTTDRIKETLFNMIADGLFGCSFLDLFAGSGGIGIEALSRGAKRAVFVEKNPQACACVRENLAHTKLSAQAETMQADALNALVRLSGRESFDYIYMDPPYGKELEKKALAFLADSSLLAEDGVIIIEASLDTAFDDIEELGYSIIKSKGYKTNKHVFLKRADASA